MPVYDTLVGAGLVDSQSAIHKSNRGACWDLLDNTRFHGPNGEGAKCAPKAVQRRSMASYLHRSLGSPRLSCVEMSIDSDHQLKVRSAKQAAEPGGGLAGPAPPAELAHSPLARRACCPESTCSCWSTTARASRT